MQPKSDARSWKHRRRLVFGVTAAACAGLGYLIGWGADTDLHRQIAGSLGTIIIAVIGAYIGGATADDALRDRYGKKPHDEPDNLAPHGRVTYAEHD
jgi:hypothetical protein